MFTLTTPQATTTHATAREAIRAGRAIDPRAHGTLYRLDAGGGWVAVRLFVLRRGAVRGRRAT